MQAAFGRIGDEPGDRSLALDQLHGPGAGQGLDAAIEESLEQCGPCPPPSTRTSADFTLPDDAQIDRFAHLELAALGHGQAGHEGTGLRRGGPLAQLAPASNGSGSSERPHHLPPT